MAATQHQPGCSAAVHSRVMQQRALAARKHWLKLHGNVLFHLGIGVHELLQLFSDAGELQRGLSCESISSQALFLCLSSL